MPLPLCASPGLSLSSLQITCLQQADSSATAFRPPSGIRPWPKPAGCFSHSCLRAYILALAMGGAGFFPPLPFLFCFVCLCAVVAQFTHSRTVMLDRPSPQQLSDPSTRRQQTRNKQRTGEKFQSVFRETCYFKGSSEFPPELITVAGEIRQGGSFSVGSQGIEKTENGGKKKKSPQEVQFSYFLNYQLYPSELKK